jgi:hypothetical protein
MKLETSLLAVAALLASAGVGCSAQNRGEPMVLADGGVAPGAFADGGGIATNNGGVADPRCPKETQYVFVIDNTGTLYRFDPPTAAFTSVGPIKCPGSVYSMAIDRKAFAWIVQSDGKLVKVDTRDASCSVTPFLAGQQGFSANFGMGFSTNAAGSEEETLFVSDSIMHGLGKIDTGNLTLTKVGAYDKLKARAELTGTGDGRLFGAFEGTPYVVAEIQKAAATIQSEAPQAAINYPPNSSNFAFAFWGGEFFLFVGPGTSTDVFKYSPDDGKTEKIQSTSFVIVGAGVSTCAPTTKPR